jgi:alkyl hydroperoxide reductase subunit F
VSENIGGQVRETKGIENSISTPYIEGPELADKLKQHVLEYPITILENQSVGSVKMGETKTMALKGGVRVHAPVVIAATGASWRKLGVAGETEYMGRGVAFCPHCDGPFYRDKEIVVVGGGNSGTEAALDLANICSKVTLLERNTAIKADQVLVDKVHRAGNIEVITSAQTQEILGDGQTVQGLRYKNLISGTETVMDVAGVFIQIGLVPNSSWIGDHLDVTSYGEIQVNERNQTSVEGVFAAGDVSTVPYKQIVIAMGEGAKAGLSAFEYLLKRPQ